MSDEKLIDAIKKMLPVIEEAYWDHWSAGHIPGSGYSHRCYHKLPFTWREEDKFKKWIKEVKGFIEDESTRPKCALPSWQTVLDVMDEYTAAPKDGDYDRHTYNAMKAVYDYMKAFERKEG